MKNNKLGQEEMVGFGLILIIISVIILVFIVLTLTGPRTQEIESYEVQSFLQALLQHTTDCEDYLGYLSVQNLIFECKSKGRCLNERDACEVLNESLKDVINNVWDLKQQQGYEFLILSDEEVMLELIEGNVTSSYRGAVQRFSRYGEAMQISFRAYF